MFQFKKNKKNKTEYKCPNCKKEIIVYWIDTDELEFVECGECGKTMIKTCMKFI